MTKLMPYVVGISVCLAGWYSCICAVFIESPSPGFTIQLVPPSPKKKQSQTTNTEDVRKKANKPVRPNGTSVRTVRPTDSTSC